MGGTALILVGAILTSMLQFYFADGYPAQGIVRSRWWWEIVLNIQILAVAFMWFCYVDRVADATGVRKRVMRLQMYFGLAVVLVPLWMALLSAYLNWFVVRPPIEIIDLFMCGLLGVWGLIALLPRLMILNSKSSQYQGVTLLSLLKPRAWYLLTPLYVLIAIWVVWAIADNIIHYQYTPLLLYIQAAVPYFERGLGRRTVAAG